MQNNSYDYTSTTTQNGDTSNIINYAFRSHTALKLAYPQDEIVFHQKKGLPIKLSVQNFMIIYANCKHGILHSFKIPIRSNINWKIRNGLNDGAFKLGYATNIEYNVQESGDCVIYYPPREGIRSGKEREVKISVTIKSNKGNNEKKYLLTIILLKESGFRNRMSYRARTDLKKEEKYDDKQKINNNLLNDDNDGVEIEDDTAGKLISRGLVTFITNIDESKFCNECRLQITFDTPKKNDISMQQLQGYFLTSEYIKINITKNNNSDDNDDDGLSIIYLSENGYKNHKVIDDVYLQSTLIWESSSGSFPGGNTSGESIIYLTPSEDELSKSPVILTLYAIYNTSFDNNNIVKDKILVDRKKMWLLRRPAIMGG